MPQLHSETFANALRQAAGRAVRHANSKSASSLSIAIPKLRNPKPEATAQATWGLLGWTAMSEMERDGSPADTSDQEAPPSLVTKALPEVP